MFMKNVKLSSYYGYDNKKKLVTYLVGICVVILVICLVFFIFKTVKDNSPSELTKSYLNNYNKLDKETVSNIKYNYDDKLTSKQEKAYIDAMKRQYEKMHYSIISENIEDNTASIVAEVTVFDYNSCYNSANNYVTKYAYRFSSIEKMVDYKLVKLSKCTDKVTYDITFRYNKNGLEWQRDSLSDDDLRKLDGTF